MVLLGNLGPDPLDIGSIPRLPYAGVSSTGTNPAGKSH